MPSVTALVSVLLAFATCGCRDVPQAMPPTRVEAPPASGHLRVIGTTFSNADGTEWHWHGITAFRLLEFVAHNRVAEAEAYLDWASKRGITVVRVLAMAKILFTLDPAEGRAALPRLLEMARQRNIHVEIVALADTASHPIDLDVHMKEVGAIAVAHPNAIVEIANEPYHGTQRATVHDVATLERLRTLVDRRVPVALGAGDGVQDYTGGDFITVHFQRTNRAAGWGPVMELAKGVTLMNRHRKPVVDDEPIGAGPVSQPGRRESDPEKFRAMGLVSRALGLGATFHYEGGLQTTIPTGPEAASFDAWMSGRQARIDGLTGEPQIVEPGSSDSAVKSWDRTRTAAVIEVRRGGRSFVVLLGVSADPAPVVADGWKEAHASRDGAVWLLALTR